MFAALSRPNRLLGLSLLVLPSLGTALPANAQDKLLTDFSSEQQVQRAWVTVNDTVMGGVSEGQYTFTGDNTLLFRGNLSLDNNGGFASVRTRTADLDMAGYDAVAIRVKGDGRTYNFDLRTASPRMASAYRQSFETRDGEWLDIRFPLEDFVLTSFGRRVNAPPPRARHARSGCASTLAFELSDGPARLIVNCGGAALAGGQVPAHIGQGLRATAAHSTLVLDNANSTAVMLHGKLGKGAEVVEVERRAIAKNVSRIEASHDGYEARFGLTHKRVLSLRKDGSQLAG